MRFSDCTPRPGQAEETCDHGHGVGCESCAALRKECERVANLPFLKRLAHRLVDFLLS